MRFDTKMELGSIESSLHIVLYELGMASMGHGLHLEPLQGAASLIHRFEFSHIDSL